ncbi:hypothetical protein HanIR_Chr13g0629161 [Helianthus annuus]|nr:hypothetical protein HanIR_Chr13g0629161 [Helianthus annuus]
MKTTWCEVCYDYVYDCHHTRSRAQRSWEPESPDTNTYNMMPYATLSPPSEHTKVLFFILPSLYNIGLLEPKHHIEGFHVINYSQRKNLAKTSSSDLDLYQHQNVQKPATQYVNITREIMLCEKSGYS